MKTYNKPATSKLVARFDNELKNLLMEDLKAFRSRNKFVAANKQAQQSLTAAWSIIYTSTYRIYITYEKSKALHNAGLYFFTRCRSAL